ncbi:PREDICTED: sodium/potassium/calcium exchanger 6, mitochondrial-like [Ceratosolen solmsi marchali]|uniref:Sodium/potassium/calcium exchanger 6, mitochondrial-like n=1 Tax=Ceratosolen solmsi marchali TaxID=326594 RepID=A0AAJ6YKM5_9HYME|nr:PREDICTED: sodium/potassium/calcium exchanger 6, mitochondrial-like [Ceratosolen solmsi marchali]
MRWPGELPKLFSLRIREDDCSYIWNIPAEKRCLWMQETESCKVYAFVPYPTLLFCTFGTENTIVFGLGLTLLFLWLLYLFFILGSIVDNFFCPSLSTIAAVLRLSENIAGVTILAFGNGAPDIFTSLVANEEERLMIFMELIGAGVFVTAIIAGTVIVFAPCQLNPKYFMRDASFYVIAVAWICLIVWDNVVHLWEALGCIGIYIVFILVVILMQHIENNQDFTEKRIPALRDSEAQSVFEQDRQEEPTAQMPRRSRAYGLHAKLDVAIEREQALNGEVPSQALKRSLSIRPEGLIREFLYDTSPVNGQEWRSASTLARILLLLRGPHMFLLQLFVPVVNETSQKRGWSKMLNCIQIAVTPIAVLWIFKLNNIKFGNISLLTICFACTCTIAVIMFALTSVDRIPRLHNAMAFLGVLTAMIVVYAVAEEVMAVLQCIGFASGISQAMLGITLLAWGNSIGDLISNVTIARKGFPRMGFSACFGGPMFNTLMGLGLNYGISAAHSQELFVRVRTSNMAPGCLLFLFCSLLCSIVYLNATGFNARKSYGYLLFTLYGIYLFINGLSEIKFIHPLGTDHRPDGVL